MGQIYAHARIWSSRVKTAPPVPDVPSRVAASKPMPLRPATHPAAGRHPGIRRQAARKYSLPGREVENRAASPGRPGRCGCPHPATDLQMTWYTYRADLRACGRIRLKSHPGQSWHALVEPQKRFMGRGANIISFQSIFHGVILFPCTTRVERSRPSTPGPAPRSA